MSDDIWYFQDIDFYKVFCPHKIKVYNNEQSHCFEDYNKEEFIYKASDKDSKVYLIKEGQVKISQITEDGKELTKAVLSKGDMFGEMVIMGQKERVDFAQCVSKAVVCPLTVQEMDGLMRNNESFSLRVKKLIGLRVQRAERMVTSLLFKSSRTRVIEYLLYLAEEKGRKVGYETLIQDFHSHKIIGNLTATSRQTVTTVLNELRAKNLINFNRQRLLIRDLDELKKAI